MARYTVSNQLANLNSSRTLTGFMAELFKTSDAVRHFRLQFLVQPLTARREVVLQPCSNQHLVYKGIR